MILINDYLHIFRNKIIAVEEDKKQLEDAKVYAGNMSLIKDVGQGKLIYKIPENTHSTQFIYTLHKSVTAQFLLVSTSYRFLTICEFTVYGKGKYFSSSENNLHISFILTSL